MRGYGSLDELETLLVLALAGDKGRRDLLEGAGVQGISLDHSSRERESADQITGCVEGARLREQGVSVGLALGQDSPSMRASASDSVNTRKLFVRTLPWADTASETRVIVSSSGASATTT